MVASMPLIWYVDGAAGSDTNGGSSEGSGKATGTGAATTMSSSTVDLSADSPDLSSVVAGDMIFITARTDGWAGIGERFEILTVNDGADTITVNPTPNSTTSGVTWTIGGALKTLIEAEDHLSNGFGYDVHVYIKASIVYKEMPYFSGVIGSSVIAMIFEGYTTTPGDNGVIEIDAESSRTYAIRTNAANHVIFRNIYGHHGNTGCLGGTGGQYTSWENCRGSNAQGTGWGFGGSTFTQWVGCRADNNAGHGFNSGGIELQVLFCVSENNGKDGIRVGGGLMLGNLSVSNADAALLMVSGSEAQMYINNTVDGDNKDSTIGISSLSQSTQFVLLNNCIYDCATGMSANSSQVTQLATVNAGNLFNGNTSDFSNWRTGRYPQTAAPAFVDEGTDWGPAAGSPLIANGVSISKFHGTAANGEISIGAFPAPPLSGADWPALGDVEDGVTYDNTGRTGTLTLPTVSNVLAAVQYGAGGTEFTGTHEEAVGGGSGFNHSGALG